MLIIILPLPIIIFIRTIVIGAAAISHPKFPNTFKNDLSSMRVTKHALTVLLSVPELAPVYYIIGFKVVLSVTMVLFVLELSFIGISVR